MSGVLVIGPSVITDGCGILQLDEAAGIARQFGSSTGSESWLALELAEPQQEPIGAATAREWQKVHVETVELIRRVNQSWVPVLFGFRHQYYNPASLGLAQLLKYDHQMSFNMFDPMVMGRSEDAYFSWLTKGGASGSCLLFTSPGIVNENAPVPDSQALSSAARHAGFRSLARWTLPDGRNVVALRRNSDSCRKK